MSVKNVKKFLDLAKSNEKLQKELILINKKLQKEEGNEEKFIADNIVPLAEKNGVTFTAKDFLKYAYEQISTLSEEDLLNISGGISARNTAAALLVTFLGSLGVGATVNLLNLSQEDGQSVVRKAEKNSGEDSRNNQDELNSNVQSDVDKTMPESGQETNVNEKNNNESEDKPVENVTKNDNEASKTSEAEQKNRREAMRNKNVVLPNSNAKSTPAVPQINVAPPQANNDKNSTSPLAPGVTGSEKHAKVGGYGPAVADSKNKPLTADEASYLVKNLKNLKKRTSLKLNKEDSKDKKAYKLLERFTITNTEILAQYINSTVFSFEGQQFDKKIKGGIPAGKSKTSERLVIPFGNESRLLQMAAHENFGHIIYPKVATTDEKKADTAKPATKTTAKVAAKKDDNAKPEIKVTTKTAESKDGTAKPEIKATTKTAESKDGNAKTEIKAAAKPETKTKLATKTAVSTAKKDETGESGSKKDEEEKPATPVTNEDATKKAVKPTDEAKGLAIAVTKVDDLDAKLAELSNTGVTGEEEHAENVGGYIRDYSSWRLWNRTVTSQAEHLVEFLNSLQRTEDDVPDLRYVSEETRARLEMDIIHVAKQLRPDPNNEEEKTLQGGYNPVQKIARENADMLLTLAKNILTSGTVTPGLVLEAIKDNIPSSDETRNLPDLLGPTEEERKIDLPDLDGSNAAFLSDALKTAIINLPDEQIHSDELSIGDERKLANLKRRLINSNDLSAQTAENSIEHVEAVGQMEKTDFVDNVGGQEYNINEVWQDIIPKKGKNGKKVTKDEKGYEEFEGQTPMSYLKNKLPKAADGLPDIGGIEDSDIREFYRQLINEVGRNIIIDKDDPDFVCCTDSKLMGSLGLNDDDLKMTILPLYNKLNDDALEFLKSLPQKEDGSADLSKGDSKLADELLLTINLIGEPIVKDKEFDQYKFVCEKLKKGRFGEAQVDKETEYTKILNLSQDELKLLYKTREALPAEQKVSFVKILNNLSKTEEGLPDLNKADPTIAMYLRLSVLSLGEQITQNRDGGYSISDEARARFNLTDDDIKTIKILGDRQAKIEKSYNRKQTAIGVAQGVALAGTAAVAAYFAAGMPTLAGVTLFGDGSIENVKKNAKAYYKGSKLESAVNKVSSTATEVAEKVKTSYEKMKNKPFEIEVTPETLASKVKRAILEKKESTANLNQVNTGINAAQIDIGILPVNASHLDPLGKTPATNLNVDAYKSDIPSGNSTMSTDATGDYLPYTLQDHQIKTGVQSTNITPTVTPAPIPTPEPLPLKKDIANNSNNNGGWLSSGWNYLKSIFERGGAPKSTPQVDYTVKGAKELDGAAAKMLQNPHIDLNTSEVPQNTALQDTSNPIVDNPLSSRLTKFMDRKTVEALKSDGGRAEKQSEAVKEHIKKILDSKRNPRPDSIKNNASYGEKGDKVITENSNIPRGTTPIEGEFLKINSKNDPKFSAIQLPTAPESPEIMQPSTFNRNAVSGNNGAIRLDNATTDLGKGPGISSNTGGMVAVPDSLEITQIKFPESNPESKVKGGEILKPSFNEGSTKNTVSGNNGAIRLDNATTDLGKGPGISSNTGGMVAVPDSLEITQIKFPESKVKGGEILKHSFNGGSHKASMPKSTMQAETRTQSGKSTSTEVAVFNKADSPAAGGQELSLKVDPNYYNSPATEVTSYDIEEPKSTEVAVFNSSSPKAGTPKNIGENDGNLEQIYKNSSNDINNMVSPVNSEQENLTPKKSADANAARIFNEYKTATGTTSADKANFDAQGKTKADLPPNQKEVLRQLDNLLKDMPKTYESGVTSVNELPPTQEQVQRIFDENVPTTEEINTNNGKGLNIPRGSTISPDPVDDEFVKIDKTNPPDQGGMWLLYRNQVEMQPSSYKVNANTDTNSTSTFTKGSNEGAGSGEKTERLKKFAEAGAGLVGMGIAAIAARNYFGGGGHGNPPGGLDGSQPGDSSSSSGYDDNDTTEVMTAEEIHTFAEQLRDINLDEFWSNIYDKSGTLLDEEKEEYVNLINFRACCNIAKDAVTWDGNAVDEKDLKTFVDYGNEIFNIDYKEGNAVKCAILNETIEDFWNVCEKNIEVLKACVGELEGKINDGFFDGFLKLFKEQAEKFLNDGKQLIADEEKEADDVEDFDKLYDQTEKNGYENEEKGSKFIKEAEKADDDIIDDESTNDDGVETVDAAAAKPAAKAVGDGGAGEDAKKKEKPAAAAPAPAQPSVAAPSSQPEAEEQLVSLEEVNAFINSVKTKRLPSDSQYDPNLDKLTEEEEKFILKFCKANKIDTNSPDPVCWIKDDNGRKLQYTGRTKLTDNGTVGNNCKIYNRRRMLRTKFLHLFVSAHVKAVQEKYAPKPSKRDT